MSRVYIGNECVNLCDLILTEEQVRQFGSWNERPGDELPASLGAVLRGGVTAVGSALWRCGLRCGGGSAVERSGPAVADLAAEDDRAGCGELAGHSLVGDHLRPSGPRRLGRGQPSATSSALVSGSVVHRSPSAYRSAGSPPGRAKPRIRRTTPHQTGSRAAGWPAWGLGRGAGGQARASGKSGGRGALAE